MYSHVNKVSRQTNSSSVHVHIFHTHGVIVSSCRFLIFCDYYAIILYNALLFLFIECIWVFNHFQCCQKSQMEKLLGIDSPISYHTFSGHSCAYS